MPFFWENLDVQAKTDPYGKYHMQENKKSPSNLMVFTRRSNWPDTHKLDLWQNDIAQVAFPCRFRICNRRSKLLIYLTADLFSMKI